jgi:hypothetical protein
MFTHTVHVIQLDCVCTDVRCLKWDLTSARACVQIFNNSGENPSNNLQTRACLLQCTHVR